MLDIMLQGLIERVGFPPGSSLSLSALSFYFCFFFQQTVDWLNSNHNPLCSIWTLCFFLSDFWLLLFLPESFHVPGPLKNLAVVCSMLMVPLSLWSSSAVSHFPFLLLDNWQISPLILSANSIVISSLYFICCVFFLLRVNFHLVLAASLFLSSISP